MPPCRSPSTSTSAAIDPVVDTNSGCRHLQDFFAGTFLPFRRASHRPMAIACFRLLTFLPLRPDFSLPRFISCISRLTSLPADFEYFRPEDFFFEDFFALDFFAAFLVAIPILPRTQMFQATSPLSSGGHRSVQDRID